MGDLTVLPSRWTSPASDHAAVWTPRPWPPAVVAVYLMIRRVAECRQLHRRLRVSVADLIEVISEQVQLAGDRVPLSLAGAARLVGVALAGRVWPRRGRCDADRAGRVDLGPCGPAGRLGFTAATVPACIDVVKRLVWDGYPTALACAVDAGWDDAGLYAAGRVPVPGPMGEPSDGAVFLVEGWDDADREWIVRHPVDTCFGKDGVGRLAQSVTPIPWVVRELVSVFDVLVMKEC